MPEQTATRALTCIQCGKCTGGCPESGKTPFNVRMLVRKTQFKSNIDESLPWYCTSCGACTLRCPRDVKPSEVIIELRSKFVEDGEIPVTIQKALENTFVQKNPWGRSRNKRGEWVEKLDFEVPHVSETESKRLLFVCCIQAYDPAVHGDPGQRGAAYSRPAGWSSAYWARKRRAAATRSEGSANRGFSRSLQEENLGDVPGIRREGDRGPIASLHEHAEEGIRRYGHKGRPLYRGACEDDRGRHLEIPRIVREEGYLS